MDAKEGPRGDREGLNLSDNATDLEMRANRARLQERPIGFMRPGRQGVHKCRKARDLATLLKR